MILLKLFHLSTLNAHFSKNSPNISRLQLSSRLLFEITLHGFLLWASLGLLMPLGVLIIRMSKGEERGRRLKTYFRAHAILQASSMTNPVKSIPEFQLFQTSTTIFFLKKTSTNPEKDNILRLSTWFIKS